MLLASCCSASSASRPSSSPGDRHARLSQLLPGAARPGVVAFEVVYMLFVVLILAVFGAAAGAIGQARVRRADCGRNAGVDGRRSSLFVTFGNKSVERLFTLCLLSSFTASTRCSSSWRFARSATGSRRLRARSPDTRLGARRPTYSGYNIIGAVVILPVAPPSDQPSRRGRRGRDCGPAGDAARRCSSSLHDRLLSGDRRARPAVRFPARSGWKCRLPLALPADDLLRLARKRDERGARDQRADRPRPGSAPRHRAHPQGPPRHRARAAGRLHVARRGASASWR